MNKRNRRTHETRQTEEGGTQIIDDPKSQYCADQSGLVGGWQKGEKDELKRAESARCAGREGCAEGEQIDRIDRQPDVRSAGQ